MVTGNNQKNTISEFKSPEYSSLKASLCSLYLHPTSSFLFYSIYHNGKCHYLKKIHWEQNKADVFSREFDSNTSFQKVTCLSFPDCSNVVPKSFVSSNKEDNKYYMGQSDVSNSIVSASLGSNKVLLFNHDSKWEDIINTCFPESNHTLSISPFLEEINDNPYSIVIATSENKTQISLKEGEALLMSEVYTTESETDSLFFTLSVLKIHNIDDQAHCNIYLLCETNEQAMKNTFQDYFENIHLASSENSSSFPLSKQDKLDFAVAINAVKCEL